MGEHRSPTPHPQLHMRLAQHGLELFILGFELQLTRGSALLALGQTITARIEKRPFPRMHRLLRHAQPPRRFSRSGLTAQHRQHDLQLLISRLLRWPRHHISLDQAST